MKQIIYFLLYLGIGVFTFACYNTAPIEPATGKPGEACKIDGTCDNGYECVDNTCICRDGGLLYHNYCVQFSDSSAVWVGYSSDCLCYDTLIFAIDGKGINTMLSSPVKIGSNLGIISPLVEFFEKPDGDSLHFFLYAPECVDQNGNAIGPEIFGKFLSNGKLRIRVLSRDLGTFTIVNDCTIELNTSK